MNKIIMVTLFLGQCTMACASTKVYFNKVVDAIYLAEGKKTAKKPFGILSVPCSGYTDCRKVCYQTVRNNWKRWESAGNPGDFISFLGSRYAPIKVHYLNRNWIPNVNSILKGGV